MVQAYNHRSDGLIIYSPTVQKSSVPILFVIAKQKEKDFWALVFQDIIKAFRQALEKLPQVIYLHPPPYLRFTTSILLRLDNSLYGFNAFGVLWFQTYHEQHRTRLFLTPSSHY